jgi:hypothetical protein
LTARKQIRKVYEKESRDFEHDKPMLSVLEKFMPVKTIQKLASLEVFDIASELPSVNPIAGDFVIYLFTITASVESLKEFFLNIKHPNSDTQAITSGRILGLLEKVAGDKAMITYVYVFACSNQSSGKLTASTAEDAKKERSESRLEQANEKRMPSGYGSMIAKILCYFQYAGRDSNVFHTHYLLSVDPTCGLLPVEVKKLVDSGERMAFCLTDWFNINSKFPDAFFMSHNFKSMIKCISYNSFYTYRHNVSLARLSKNLADNASSIFR